jgi:hypothetical protein
MPLLNGVSKCRILNRSRQCVDIVKCTTSEMEEQIAENMVTRKRK